MSRQQLTPGGAVATATLVSVTSTSAVQLFAPSSIANLREICNLSTAGIASAPLYISGSSSVTSTSGHAVPADVPFRLGAPMYRGAIWGISTATLTATTFSC
jgi:hypothetical protein